MSEYEALAFLMQHCETHNGEEYYLKQKAYEKIMEVLNGYEFFKQFNDCDDK